MMATKATNTAVVEIRLSISGMSCAGCVRSVENALQGVPGVAKATVSFAEHTALVRGEVSAHGLIQAVKEAGYEAAELKSLEDEAEKGATEMAHYYDLLRKTAVAAMVGLPLFVLGLMDWLPGLVTAAGQGFWFLVGLATLIVLVYSGRHFFTGALEVLSGTQR